jgi:hypothetical protein
MYTNGAWAYARLTDNDMFISLSIKRFETLAEFVSPEFTIFHEFGHYQIAKRFDEHYDEYGYEKIELKADRYGLFALIRMLDHNMEYKTISNLEKHKSFTNTLKAMIAQNVKPDMESAERKEVYTKIVNCIFKMHDWDNIYKNVSEL